MNSNDNINLSELKLLLDAHFARTDKLLADFRKDFAEFREQIKDDMNSFKQEVRAEINSFKNEMHSEFSSSKEENNSKFESIHAEIRVLQNEVTGIQHDVVNLQTWNYWTLSIILALIAMPQIVSGIKALFGAVSEGIAGIIAVFRKKNKG